MCLRAHNHLAGRALPPLQIVALSFSVWGRLFLSPQLQVSVVDSIDIDLCRSLRFEPGRYEEGHGLVDAVQFQKKLKNDLHRLETELEQRSLKVH